MACKRFKAETAIDIPKANGLVFSSAGKGLTIRAEGDASHSMHTVLDTSKAETGVDIP